MKDPELVQMAIDTMVTINAAITNIRLYPPSSSLISNAIDSAYSSIVSILEQEDSMVFAEAEKNLFVFGEALSEKDQKKPQVVAVLDRLVSFGIKTLVFKKGMDKQELRRFLEILTQKPAELNKEGGLQKVVETANLPHILLDAKVYVSMDKDQQIVAGPKDTEDTPKAKDEETPMYSGVERRSGEDRRKKHSSDYFLKGGVERRKKEDNRLKKLAHLKAGIESILKGQDDAFGDRQVMLAVPVAVRQLISQKRYQTAEKLIQRLGDKIIEDEPHIRDEASQVLSHIGVNLVSEQRMDILFRLSHKLITWVKSETSKTSALELICSHLQKLAQVVILNRHFAETNHILQAFHLIFSGKIQKDDTIRALVGNVLKGIATDDVLDMLLKELLVDEARKQTQAVHSLGLLGAVTVDPLPDMLQGCKYISEHDRAIPFSGEFELPFSSHERDRLQEKICNSLRRIGAQGAIPENISAAVQKDLSSIKSQTAGVQAAAENALDTLTGERTKAEEEKPSDEKGATPHIVPETVTPAKTESITDDLQQQLQVVDGHVQRDDTETAVKLLFDLIVKYAKGKNFKNAEILRGKLFEVDAMALTEIVKSGEIIEAEKSDSIDQDHLELWADLYDSLTDEEANALFYAMRKAEYEADQTIIQQGELNSRLYFIKQGQLKLVYHQESSEMHLDTLNPGDIFGDDTFFYITGCTTSVISLSPLKLNLLDKETLTKWKSEFPGLESKLRDYCLKREKTCDLLKKNGMDRRSHPRVKISGQVAIQFLDASGAPTGKTIRGELSDISAGGLCFYIKLAQEEKASKLLMQKLYMQFMLQVDDSQHKIAQKGTIVAVRYHLFNDFSIHVKFDNLLDQELNEKI